MMPASTFYRRILGSAAMNEVFSDDALIRAALEFEAALAEAEAECGVVPPDAGVVIARIARTFEPDHRAIAESGALSGTLAVPLVKALTEAVAARDSEAAAFVHFGATSQDIADSAMALMLASAVRLLIRDLERAIAGCRTLETAHRSSIMLSRTLMQPAPPTSFGLRAGGWADALETVRAELVRAGEAGIRLQFGGPAGTLGSLAGKGPDIAASLGRRLGLAVPERPWHTDRAALVALGSAAAIATGTLGKIAGDVVLLMQYEIGELFEPAGEGRGASSAMPHKRNPSLSMVALAAANRAPGLAANLMAGMVQQLDRGIGGWQGEWLTLPQLFEGAGAAAAAMAEVLEGLDVRPDRMRANLEATLGLVYSERVALALASALGRQAAKDLVAGACRTVAETGRPLGDVLAENEEANAALGADKIAKLLQPEGYLGLAEPSRGETT